MPLLEVPAPSLADKDTQSDIRSQEYGLSGGMHETGAQGWCTGKTQRDGMGGRWEGGIGMGNTCKSMADSCQCMTKPTTIL